MPEAKSEIKFEIKKNLCVLSEGSKGWQREVNVVSWNDKSPKVDIRDWDATHEKMGKGLTLNKEELIKLKEFLEKLDFEGVGIE